MNSPTQRAGRVVRNHNGITPRFIDTPTVAADLGVTTQTVRNMVRRGELRGVRIGGRLRIPVDAYENYLLRVDSAAI